MERGLQGCRKSNVVSRLLTAAEVAEILGVPVKTLYAWRYKGQGPRAAKVGKHLRYAEADVRAWFDRHAS